MKIQGVRSFGPERGQTIIFDTPLTLIVGFNGSGKTTIIECLKYATTGLLPPFAKTTGAFIHDPKLTGEKEVPAQVKLKFKNASGASMVCTRSMSATLLSTMKRSMKTTDCNLTFMNGTERTSVSSKVVEMDTIVPQYLGVSQAILDNVIFCHQDESFWPLSEPSVLKKKFDEIFEALKYTKAIENLRKLGTAKKGELKVLAVNEANDKVNKDRGEKCQKKIREVSAQIETTRAEVNSMDEQIVALSAAVNDKHQEVLDAQQVFTRLENARTQAGFVEGQVKSLESRVQMMDEPDAVLQAEVEKYEERLAQYYQQSETFQAEYHELEQAVKNVREDLSNKTTELGQLQAEKISYESKIQDRIGLVKEAAHRHSLRGYDGDLEPSQVAEFVDKIRKQSREKDRELERIQRETGDELRGAQEIIDDLKTRRSDYTNTRVTAKNTIESNSKKNRTLQQRVDLLKVDEGQQATLEASLNSTKQRLQAASTGFDTADHDKELRDLNSKVQGLESESEKWRNELTLSLKLAKDNASLEYTRDLLSKSQKRLETMKLTHDANLAKSVSPQWRAETLERDFQGVLNEKTEKLADAKVKQEESSRALGQAEYKLKTLRENLKGTQTKAKNCQIVVVNSITDDGMPLANIESYVEALEALEMDHQTVLSDYNNFSHLQSYYESCLKTINKKDHCQLCERKFADQDSKSTAVNKIRAKMEQKKKDSLKESLAELKEELKDAQAARSEYDTYVQLTKYEIPDIEENIAKADNERDRLLRITEQHDHSVDEMTSAKKEVESLTQPISKIVQYNSEILQYSKEVDSLSSNQKSFGTTLSGDEIRVKDEECRESMRSLTSKRDKVLAEKDQATAVINKLRMEEQRASSDLKDARRELAEKKSLQSQIEELRESTNQQRESIRNVDRDLEALGPQISSANAKHEEIQRQGRVKEADVQTTKNKLAETANRFKMLDSEIARYVEDGGPEKLVACQRVIKTLTAEQLRIDGEKETAAAKANAIKKKIDDSDTRKRTIADNIAYRDQVLQLRKLQETVAELEYNSNTDDYDHLKRQLKRLTDQESTLKAKRISLASFMTTTDQQLAEKLEEWQLEYSESALQYRKTHIKAETTKAAVQDIEQYMNALDKAVMQFHSLKMEEINRIAAELWQQTYQGTDVDTIMIRSDPEDSNSKKNFHYRLVMVKQDAEMDMRGRCSAGQRVLASIIIRLALAECFGTNCGIIALDEPTTNLDADNIRSLAASLNAIIKVRQQQANFQLIVITHDEEFLKVMKCQEFTETYWRVGRDKDQKSTIERNDISLLMES